MNKCELTIDNNNNTVIKLSAIIKLIPKNNLNWYILELIASGDLMASKIKVNMSDLKNRINLSSSGLKIDFFELLELANNIDNLDECFIVGCKHDNKSSINQILSNKEKYDYIIDYFDSTILHIFSSDLVFIEHLLKSYNNGMFSPATASL